MHITDIQYIRCNNNHINTSTMHNLDTNFSKFFEITKSVFKNRINQYDNLHEYRNKPKMSDCQIIALSITSESLGIDSESYLWGKLMNDYRSSFPYLIDRSNYNRRRKKLFPDISELNQIIANRLNIDEDVFLVDSIPVPVCQIAREKQSKICRENFETAPDKGYSAVSKSYYYGYKLHVVASMRGIFHSMDLTKASVHDITYLSQVKYSGLNNCTLIGDRGYLSSSCQLDLFETSQIKLETPYRINQHNYKPFPFVFKKVRKRIETLFAQLCDQFMLKRNYAKTISGLSVRILCKITAATLLQFINDRNSRPLNHLKYALAN
jgi:hypothetical protein